MLAVHTHALLRHRYRGAIDRCRDAVAAGAWNGFFELECEFALAFAFTCTAQAPTAGAALLSLVLPHVLVVLARLVWSLTGRAPVDVPLATDAIVDLSAHLAKILSCDKGCLLEPVPLCARFLLLLALGTAEAVAAGR